MKSGVNIKKKSLRNTIWMHKKGIKLADRNAKNVIYGNVERRKQEIYGAVKSGVNIRKKKIIVEKYNMD